MKRLFNAIAFVLPLLTLCSCHDKKEAVNFVQNLSTCDSEIFIRNWEFTLPDTIQSYEVKNIQHGSGLDIKDQADNLQDYQSFEGLFNQPSISQASAYSPFSRFPDTLKGSYMALDTFFHVTDIPISVYAASVINSETEQDAALIVGANNAIQLWVNGKSALKKYTESFISGYQYLLKVHLKKGPNFVLSKLTHIAGDWRYFMKVCAVNYANENSLGSNYSSICDQYLLKNGDSLSIKLHSPLIHRQHPFTVAISDANDKIIWKCKLKYWDNKSPKIPMKSISQGLYQIRMTSDANDFHQYFFYGDYRKYFDNLSAKISQISKDYRTSKTAKLLQERFIYLDTAGIPHDNEYERKLTANLFELKKFYDNISNHKSPFKDITGLHLTSQSVPEHAADMYMTYMPKQYKPDKPIPLVVMMPVQTGVRHFNISTYVSNIDAIEHIESLADKYNFGVLWSSFRMYSDYSLTRIVPETILESVKAVESDYNIDTNRIYACGDCAGGEWALFMGRHLPGYFAGIATEGTAIPLADNSMAPAEIPPYNFFDTPENFSNTPILIMHSTNDRKCSYLLARQLVDTIRKTGGNIIFKPLHVLKGMDLYFMNLMPENKILTDMFSFFNRERKRTPDTITFSTYQLKYNKAFWITIDDKPSNAKSVVHAVINQGHNLITISSQNVAKLSVDLEAFDQMNINKPVTLEWNNRTWHFPLIRKGVYTAALMADAGLLTAKSSLIEGPVNDFFAKPFMLVIGTRGDKNKDLAYKLAANAFQQQWRSYFMEDTCKIKKDIEVTTQDCKEYNLLVLGTAETNTFTAKVEGHIPLKVNSNEIVLRHKEIKGQHLNFLVLNPNPLCTGKYILLAASNDNNFDVNILDRAFFNSWYDYKVTSEGRQIATGYFDKNWQ